MNNKNLLKLNWRKALSTLAIGFGAVGYLNTSAIATPIKDNFQVAQIGVRSRVTPPVPLNLRPRTHHTPLPRSRYSHYPSHSYPKRNTSYGKHHQYNRNNRRYDHHNHSHDGRIYRNRRRTGGTVIIISPGNHSGYRNYSKYGSYIRVIGK